jgi:DNA-binding GntR family transcriptional regulator
MTASVASPLASTALYEQVADELRGRILAREMEPGSWIDELKLCGELGISRTPLREALKVLAAEGLVTMKLRRGAYVTEMSERDVREAYQLLALLESDAAAEVATRASDAELQELARLHDDLEAALPDRDAFFAANERFHLRVLKLNRHHSLFREGRLEESLQEHRAIVQALRARDAASCRLLVQAHFANGLSATQTAA